MTELTEVHHRVSETAPPDNCVRRDEGALLPELKASARIAESWYQQGSPQAVLRISRVHG